MPGGINPSVKGTDTLAAYFRQINQRLATLERALANVGGGDTPTQFWNAAWGSRGIVQLPATTALTAGVAATAATLSPVNLYAGRRYQVTAWTRAWASNPATAAANVTMSVTGPFIAAAQNSHDQYSVSNGYSQMEWEATIDCTVDTPTAAYAVTFNCNVAATIYGGSNSGLAVRDLGPTTMVPTAPPPADWAPFDSRFVNAAGDTMTGALVLPAPAAAGDAANKAYVDAAVARVPVMRVYTAATNTWTKPANLVAVLVKVQAGGGGSGGCPATAAAQCTGGGSGGGGGYAEEMIAASALLASETVLVGAGGAAGTTTTAGGAGGTSSFGTTPYLSATGGAGGAVGTAQAPPIMQHGGVAGGAGSGGAINISGGNSYPYIATSATRAYRAPGGGSVLGAVDASAITTTTQGSAAGGAYGAGASGGVNCQSQAAALAGALGGAGVVIVYEFY